MGPGVRSGAAVADGVVYIGGQSRVVAFETATGRQIWEGKVSGPAHGVPAIAGDALYLGTLNKNVIALERSTGQPKWEYQGDSPFPGSVTVHNGIVYAGSRGGEVQALDAESGKALWEVGLGSPAVAPVAVRTADCTLPQAPECSSPDTTGPATSGREYALAQRW